MDDRDEFSARPKELSERSLDAIALLRGELDSAFGAGRALTRDTALQLLQIFSDTLGPSLRIAEGETDSGDVVVTDHPGILLLDELRDAIDDLKNAKSHPALEPASYGANASKSSKLAKSDRALLELVEVTKWDKQFKTRKEAEVEVAARLKKKGTKRKGDEITPTLLKSIRDRARIKGGEG
jgi:hypothetical protein